MLKEELRKKFITYRKYINPKNKKVNDIAISKKIFKLNKFKSHKNILTYVSKPNEVDTFEIIEKSWKNNKNIAIPKCDLKTHDMKFYILNNFDDLEVSTFGIQEPKTQICKQLKNYSDSIILVPGLAFDSNGFRLGYGGGFYDRFLAKFNIFSIGICYSKCFCKNLPHKPHDKPVNLVITESETYKF